MAPKSLRSKNPQKFQMNQNDLRFKQGVALMPKELAFSGTAIANDKNGKKVSEANYLHGQLHGDVTFTPVGLRLLFTYEKGKFKSGIQSWYPNGQKDLDSDLTKKAAGASPNIIRMAKKKKKALTVTNNKPASDGTKTGNSKAKRFAKTVITPKRWFKSGGSRAKGDSRR